MSKNKLIKIDSKEGEVKCTLPLKKITKKEAKELEKLRNEYILYDETEFDYTIQSPIVNYLIEEQIGESSE